MRPSVVRACCLDIVSGSAVTASAGLWCRVARCQWRLNSPASRLSLLGVVSMCAGLMREAGGGSRSPGEKMQRSRRSRLVSTFVVRCALALVASGASGRTPHQPERRVSIGHVCMLPHVTRASLWLKSYRPSLAARTSRYSAFRLYAGRARPLGVVCIARGWSLCRPTAVGLSVVG